MAFIEPITDFIENIPILIGDVKSMASSEGGSFEALNRAAEATSEAVADATGGGSNPM